MKLLLTGATGVAGIEALRFALSDPAITHVTVLSRRPLPPSIPPQAYADPTTVPDYSNSTSSSSYPPYTPTPDEVAKLGTHKLTVIQHSDFTSYPPAVVDKIKDHGGCVWALGGSTKGLDEATYTKMTHDFPVAALNALKDAGVKGEEGKPFRFVYISGEGADRTEKSMFLFGRVKGRTETSLLSIASSSSITPIRAQFIRPGYFFPSHPYDRTIFRPASARAMDCFMTPVLSTIAPSARVAASSLGRFAVEIAKGSLEEKELWGNKAMVEVIGKWEKAEKATNKKDEL